MLRVIWNRIAHDLAAISLGQARALFSPGALAFLLPCFLMAMSFTIFSDGFGKLGIPIQLPESSGTISNFSPKIFPMEIFLVGMTILTLARLRLSTLKPFLHPLPALVVFLMIFGVARAVPDFRANPILVLRNSAFVWYLSLSLMIAAYPISSRTWEQFFRVLYLAAFFYFLANLPFPVYTRSFAMNYWGIDLGLLLAVAYGFCGPGRMLPGVALTAVGFALGISYFGSFQRTTLLGIGLTLLILASTYFLPARFPRPSWKRISWAAAGVALAVICAVSVRASKGGAELIASSVDVVATANPGRVAEKNSAGFEKFRYYMWRDSVDLFLSSPMVGIGFLKPVVYRAYAGAGQFKDNSSSIEHLPAPPVAGPHNSYLNALARLGILGGAYLVLHATLLFWFFSKRYFACGFVLLWQMLYASFNVSFEGPIRSFPILLLVGVGLRLASETRLPRPEGEAS